MFNRKKTDKPLLNTNLLNVSAKTTINNSESLEHIDIENKVVNKHLSLEEDELDETSNDDSLNIPEDDTDVDDLEDSGMDALGDTDEDSDFDSDEELEDTDDDKVEKSRKVKLSELFSELETSVIKTIDRISSINDASVLHLLSDLNKFLVDLTRYIDGSITTDKSKDILAMQLLFREEYTQLSNAVNAYLGDLIQD